MTAKPSSRSQIKNRLADYGASPTVPPIEEVEEL